MGVKIREKRKRLYLDVYHQGRRAWQALGLTLGADAHTNREMWRLAEVIRQKRELQIASGEWGLLDPIEGKRTLLKYAQGIAKLRSPKDHIAKSLKYLAEYCKDIRLGSVTERFLEGYQGFLLEKGLSKTTAAHYYAALKYILKRATRDRMIPRNPAEAVKGMNVPETVKVHLSVEEIQRLASTALGGALGAEVKKAFLFGCFTGLRISDLKSLAWGEIQRDPPQITKRQEKTGRIVGIPLKESAWRIIDDKALHKRGEKVFPLLTASETNTNQYLVAWAKRAGVDKQIGWHTARHTFAVLALEGGADFFTVSKLMGHTKPQITAVYAKATDRLKRQAISGLPDVSLPKANA
jgi:integrase